VQADWALIHVEGFTQIQPVYLSKNPPRSGESLYTKGFTRCKPHDGTDIAQAMTLNNGVLLWQPNAISGQSGSGVWSDDDNLQKALLTWSMQRSGRWFGAGQLTSEIYKQNRSQELRGYPRMEGLIELPGDYDLNDTDRTGLDDPVVEEGFFSIPIERGIQEFPIWAEDMKPEPEQPQDPDCPTDASQAINALRRIRDSVDDEIKKFESGLSNPVDPDDDNAFRGTFGL
jgi:hypothetical protein